MTLNDNIIPYVPIADRIQANNPTSELLCQQFFRLIDKIVQSQFIFNHDTTHGHLSINPEHINDLIKELNEKGVDISLLEQHLNNLVYPKYLGIKEIKSSIWDQAPTTVWQFQLNQIHKEEPKMISHDDAEFLLDQALGYIRIWKGSLETNTINPQTTYRANDLVYALSDIELKLDQVQKFMSNIE